MINADKNNKTYVEENYPKTSFPPELIKEYQEKKIERKRKKMFILRSFLSVCLVFILATTIGFIFSKVPASKIVKGTTIKQEQIVAGQQVKWVTLVNKQQIADGKYLAQLPRSAKNIKISSVTAQQAQDILTTRPTQQLSLLQRQQLAVTPIKSSKLKQFFSAALSSSAKDFLGAISNNFNYLLADVVDGVNNIAKLVIGSEADKNIIMTGGATYVNVSSEVTLTPSTSSDSVAIEYTTPAPQITAEITDLDQQVIVSATNEDPQTPLTDVLASTKIPELFKVGQEDKIKIKWESNNNQVVLFNAHDTDNNGYLDYVEWTVPHLSTQLFDVILISKAFQLDAGQNIMADIYPQTQVQDNNYAYLTDSQYVRVTFEKLLTSKNDNTIYAKAADSNSPATIEVYPAYVDQDGNITDGPLVATFNNISDAKTYKVLLTNLQTPTDTFDLKVIGAVAIDYIVDPDLYHWVGGTASNGLSADSWDNSANWTVGGQVSDTPPPSGANVTIDSNSTNSPVIPVGYSNNGGRGVTLGDVTIDDSENSYTIINNGTIADITGTLSVSAGAYGIDNYATITDISGTVSVSLNGTGINNEAGATVSDISGAMTVGSAAYGIYNYGTITDISGTLTITSDGFGIYNDSGATITDISGTLANNGAQVGIDNSGGITDISGIFTNSGGGYGIENSGTITNISGGSLAHPLGGFTNSGSGKGIDNYNTITDISGTFANSGSDIGIANYGTITAISGTFTNSGTDNGIRIGNSYASYGTININGTFNNTGVAVGIVNYNGIVAGSGIITGNVTLPANDGCVGVLDLSTGLTVDGTLSNVGGTVTPVTSFNCTTIIKTLGSINDGLHDYAMCILPTAVCGNGILEGAEACDDGNTSSSDGCNGTCAAIESGYTCPTPGAPCVVSIADISVTGVTFSEHSTALTVGGTHQLTDTVAPTNATDTSVAWSSSNGLVATVNGTGLVTAVSAGSAIITVTTTDGNYTDTTAVTVASAVTTPTGGGMPTPPPQLSQAIIDSISQVLSSLKQYVSSLFFSKNASPSVQPVTPPPTNLQPTQPPPTQTSTVSNNNQNAIISIYQKILNSIVSLLNLFVAPNYGQ